MSRIYGNCYELMSELFREVWEMGHIVHPNSMQNKIVKGDEEYSTREIINYSYTLTSLRKADYLFLADNKSREWADAEFEERINHDTVNPGIAWKIRDYVWKQFLNSDGQFDYIYSQRINYADALDKVIKELKSNPDSRQAIISIWHPTDIQGIGGKFRVPCSIYYQFLIRKGRLNIVYNQRSADIVTHFGNDVYLAWKLMQYVAGKVNVDPGYLFHNIGSLHSYKKDWPTLKRCIEEVKI